MIRKKELQPAIGALRDPEAAALNRFAVMDLCGHMERHLSKQEQS